MSGQEIKLPISDRVYARTIPHVIGVAVVNFLETARARIVNPKSNPLSWVDIQTIGRLRQPDFQLLHDNPILFNILQNSGDFYDGYV